MAQIDMISVKTEIKSAPSKIYNFNKYNMSQYVNLNPQIVKKVEVIEGEEGKIGNVKLIEYVIGKPMSLKMKVVELDDEEKSITFDVLEGDLLQMYSSFKVRVSASEGCATWSIEFEKLNEAVPNPDIYTKVADGLTKLLDAYLLTH
ncbi:kirola-like [Andrographis paniculata]|uniref:kirola-like n=1 Tax=Andrographis paniculata TaxID=175694 RepID=UPI0021E98321|nr:kirola-like [Andrographis paniculata]